MFVTNKLGSLTKLRFTPLPHMGMSLRDTPRGGLLIIVQDI